MSYYVTDVAADASVVQPASSVDDSKDDASEKDASVTHTGRPPLPAIIKDICEQSGTVAIACTCLYARGPGLQYFLYM